VSSSPSRPSSHRAGRPRRTAALPNADAGEGAGTTAAVIRRALPSLAAVTAVVAVILLLLVLNNRPTPSGPGPGAVAEKPASSRISESPSPTPSTSAPAPPVTEPPATQPPAATPAARLPVTVLNNSRITHLAARVAADLAAHGWPVRKTGNFTGRIRSTTVYYAAGQRASAVRLARQFHQIRRVLPRFAGLPGRGLTLVVTRDWSA
jgi:hypothetical protein